ncbi:hypothetical protein [Streptomyces lasiicapitis]|uniref:hypothetical protein n=1 Tax=Streptomyces lasiicapitis TaxID=1923961 RepID=UPI0036835843
MTDLVQATDVILVGAIVSVSVLAAVGAAGISLAGYALYRYLRGRRCDHTPAAPDNQPGTDEDDLWTCRRIHAASDQGEERP